MDTATARAFLDGLVDPARVQTLRYSPIIKAGKYMHVQVPESLREGEPITLVEVESAAEVGAILKKANDRETPVYVRQGVGGVTMDVIRPEPPGSLVLDLRRLKWIRPNLDGGYVEVGPAVPESALNEALAPHGFSYPEFVGPVTWGGLAASNTSGRSVDPYWGKPGDYLMGLEVALPTGEVIWTGTRSHRRPCGVDLTRLFAGFQAMAGVITNLRLRLVPTPRNTRWGVVYIPTVEDAGRTVARLYRQGVPPPRLMELMDDQFLELGGLTNEDRDAVILIGTDGWTEVEAQAKLDAIFEVARAEGARRTEQVTYEAFQNFVGFRNVGEKADLIKELGLFPLLGGVMDGPLDAMAPCMEAAGRMLDEMCAANPGLYGVRIGHIGGGTFHPVFFAPQSWEFDRLQALSAEMHQRMLELQLEFGCTTGEQGVFPQHYEWFQRYYGPEHAAVVGRVRDALDPRHVLNPARFERPIYRAGA